MMDLQVFGTLALRDARGEDIRSVLAQPKRVALLVYLAIARPHGFHRRDTLLALLWPEQDEQHARRALNQALRHLRNALGRDVVAPRRRGIGLIGSGFNARCEGHPAAEACDQHQGPGPDRTGKNWHQSSVEDIFGNRS